MIASHCEAGYDGESNALEKSCGEVGRRAWFLTRLRPAIISFCKSLVYSLRNQLSQWYKTVNDKQIDIDWRKAAGPPFKRFHCTEPVDLICLNRKLFFKKHYLLIDIRSELYIHAVLIIYLAIAETDSISDSIVKTFFGSTRRFHRIDPVDLICLNVVLSVDKRSVGTVCLERLPQPDW